MDEHERDEPREAPCGPPRGDGSYPSDQAPGGPENGVPGPIPWGWAIPWRTYRGPHRRVADVVYGPRAAAARREPSGHSVGMVEAWGRLRSTADIGGIFTRPSGHSVTNPGDEHMKINITVVIKPIDPNAVAANPRDVMDEVAWLLKDRRVRAQAQDRPDGYKAYYEIRRVDVEEAGS